jgi:succinyl-CoA synthetase beta subunit
MATMDAIARAGGKPANFLDVGGGVTKERIAEALRQVVKLGVEGILVNAYGGINNCATMAEGVVEAVQSIPVSQALIVRMQGHFEEEGWAVLEETGVDVVKRGTTREAAERLVAQVDARNRGKGRGDSAG